MKLEQFKLSIQEKDLDNADLVAKVWETELSVKEKVILSLEIYDLEPSYFVLTNMWLGYSLSGKVTIETDELILNKYLIELSNPGKNLEGSTEYSLYFDIFEDPDRSRTAWNYFLSKDPNAKFIKTMLANSGPVPYELKHQLYERLIPDKSFHRDIFISIRHSCFDNCGDIDKKRALGVLNKLDLNDQIDELNSQKGFRKYQEVIACLKDEIKQ
jgi:hypothetical protein